MEHSLILIVLALTFAFSNGFRDSSSIIATVVSTRILTPLKAYVMCAIAEFLGAVFLGSAIVTTLRKGVFGPALAGPHEYLLVVLAAALLATIGWGVLCWWRAWPISNTQALFAGIIGAGLVMWGPQHFKSLTFGAVIMVLILSPLIGFAGSYIVTSVIRWGGDWLTPKIQPYFDVLHMVSSFFVALAHGSNDGQIAMGLLVLAMGTATSVVPLPMRLLVGFVIACGILLGGRRLIKKLGMQCYKVRSLEAVSSQLTSAGTVMTGALAGFPVSTTQVITGALLGAGVVKNPRAIRWNVAEDIVWSWLITMPSVFFGAGLIAFLIRWGGGL